MSLNFHPSFMGSSIVKDFAVDGIGGNVRANFNLSPGLLNSVRYGDIKLLQI